MTMIKALITLKGGRALIIGAAGGLGKVLESVLAELSTVWCWVTGLVMTATIGVEKRQGDSIIMDAQ